MIYKISPHPSLLKRGREKAEMTHSVTRRAKKISGEQCGYGTNVFVVLQLAA
jgi:hypothetical protein